ncbi:MAG TPA: tripartite tricarboxylate transporter substrate binding protein [Burkholderiaceae bacterium]
MNPSLKHTLLAAATVCLGLAAATAQAQTYPNRSLRLIVPFAPGGTTDVVARAVAAALTERLKQSVVVENRAGAGGIVGTDAVAKAPPDGYTVLLGSSGPLSFNPSLYAKLPYDPTHDFTPVGMICTSALVLVSGPRSELSSVGALIKAAKASPGKYTYSSAGIGSATHVATELFDSLAGIQTLHVPYKGSGPATIGVVAGETSFSFTGQTLAWPLVTSGKLRAIAIASDHRSPEHPDVPTAAEAGVPGFEAADWDALLLPKGTPPAIVKRLNDELAALLKEPALKSALAAQGIETHFSTPEQLNTFMQAEIAKWAPVIKKADIKLE